MLFRIESTDHDNTRPAQTPEELEGRLKAALKQWVETTPQATDAKAAAAHEAIASVATAGISKPEQAAAMTKKAVDDWKAIVKANSSALDDEHTEVVELCTAAIAGAVAQAKALGVPCRVSLVGHADPILEDGLYTRPRLRIETHIDLAKHGSSAAIRS